VNTVPSNLEDEILLDSEQVRQLVNLSDATVRRLMAIGEFPKPRFLGSKKRLWRAGEIRAVIASGVGKESKIRPPQESRWAARKALTA
jgi:predicted DNA-binding transcriptional regulator AlpA